MDQGSVCSSLVELLDRESTSSVFEEGISYALFKVAEQGLVYAAEILLRYGANLNFEGEPQLSSFHETYFNTALLYHHFVYFCFT